MKQLFLFFTIIFLSNATLAQENADQVPLEEPEISVNWESSYKRALKKSKKENKPILMYFTGSDWCGPCKILDKKLFHSDKFRNIADKDLILYEVDNPRNKDLLSAKKLEENYKLISKYRVKSYPTLVFLNHEGTMIGYKKGLILTECYYPFIQSVIENY